MTLGYQFNKFDNDINLRITVCCREETRVISANKSSYYSYGDLLITDRIYRVTREVRDIKQSTLNCLT